jgi:GNAT superfamily N-acetyltransferase
MGTVLVRLTKILHTPPCHDGDGQFPVRTYRGPGDIPVWLEIRERAFAGQIAAGRPWTEHDFRREFLEKPWWRPEWMWFAEEGNQPCRPIGGLGVAAMRPIQDGAASIQWLLVLPEHRRRGVGRCLITALEAAAWTTGFRTVVAETLGAWDAAIRFYESIGYTATELPRGAGVSR